jgi:hypothetical protein
VNQDIAAAYAATGNTMETAQQKAMSALSQTTDSMKLMDAAMKVIETSIISLDDQLSKQRVLSIDTSGAMKQIQDLIAAAAKIGFNPSPSSGGTGDNGGGYDPGDGSFATGTNYVPHTGLYTLHQGEAVVPKEQNKKGGGSTTITGGITINLPPGVNVSNPRAFARDLAPVLDEEIARYRQQAGKS